MKSGTREAADPPRPDGKRDAISFFRPQNSMRRIPWKFGFGVYQLL